MLVVAILLTIVSALLWAGVLALAIYGVRQLIRHDKEHGIKAASDGGAGIS